MAFSTRQRLTPEQAGPKIRHFCAYQERCHQEVKDKLYGFGLHSREVDQIMAALIEENFLNEERFATLFAGGKFRIKKWGRVKIRYALTQKRISTYCINSALKEIPTDQYQQTLLKLATDKYEALKAIPNGYIKNARVMEYLMKKGYEADLIREILQHPELELYQLNRK